MSDTRQVVLAKPDDVLLISNVGRTPVQQLQHARDALRHLGIEALFFAAEVDLGAPPAPPAASGPLRDIVMEQLRASDMIALALEPEKVADRLLRAVQERLRAQVGRNDCGCGGCDSCAQHALIDSMTDPCQEEHSASA